MAATRPIEQIEAEFDDDVVEAVKAASAKVGDEGSTPSSDGSDLKQTRGTGINMDAPD